MTNTGLITDLSAIGAIDRTADLLEIVDFSANTSFNVTVNNLIGITGGNVLSTTDTQSVSNKTFGNTNTIIAKDGSLTLQNTSDVTKQAVFSLGSITAGNTRTYTLPDATTTLVGTGTAQTLTSKTLTSPTITGGTIDNAAVTVDSISGHTTSNTGTIYGISVAAGVVSTANSVNGTALTNSSVTASKLNLGPQVGTVATNETTTSSTYTDLATTTDTVTVTIGVNGVALIILTADFFNNTSNDFVYVSFTASGANVLGAGDATALVNKNITNGQELAMSWSKLLTGLATGSTTFKMKYRVNAGTGNYANRSITVIPF